jgi:hypothetical protein
MFIGVFMKRYKLSEKLFEHINLVEPYPDLVTKVTTMIDITAFFPGGKGLWKEEDLMFFRTRFFN